MDEQRPRSNVCANPVGRAMYLAAGSLSLALGIVGIVLPVLPTTPFLILAAWCYARGSERCYRWLLTNRVFGRHLSDYLCGRGVSWRVKAGALVLLWVAIALSAVFAVESLWARVLLVVVAVGVSVHVVLIKRRGRVS
jgi:uncharacterized membrane protein YbaN (DUF454 family)